jgi:hypothetical protein
MSLVGAKMKELELATRASVSSLPPISFCYQLSIEQGAMLDSFDISERDGVRGGRERKGFQRD